MQPPIAYQLPRPLSKRMCHCRDLCHGYGNPTAVFICIATPGSAGVLDGFSVQPDFQEVLAPYSTFKGPYSELKSACTPGSILQPAMQQRTPGIQVRGTPCHTAACARCVDVVRDAPSNPAVCARHIDMEYRMHMCMCSCTMPV